VRLADQVRRTLAASPSVRPLTTVDDEPARRSRLAQLRQELERINQRYRESSGSRLPVASPWPAASLPPLPDPIDAEGELYRHCFPPGHAFGQVCIDTPPEALSRVERLLRIEASWTASAPLRASDLLFLDIETTGLSRSAGTLAVVIGVGRYVGTADGATHLEVDQLLLRDPGREAPILERLQRYLAQARALVTFNGRGFDVPVLRNRAVLCRTPLALDSPHLDLLPVCRRLFRPRLLNCRLGTLEQQLLRFHRHGDLDGAEVPRIYADYLRTGRTEELGWVLEHNRLDVAVLAALLVRVSLHVVEPLQWAEDAEELLATGRLHLLHGDVTLGRACLERGLELTRRHTTRRRLLAQLASHHRRSGELARARELWERCRVEFPEENAPWVELAKYHEHVSKDLGQALALAEQAPHQSSDEHQRRLERLRRRLERGRSVPQ